MKSNRIFAARQQAFELKQLKQTQKIIRDQASIRRALQGEGEVLSWNTLLQFSECFAISMMTNPEFYEKSHPTTPSVLISSPMRFSKKTNWMLLGATLLLMIQSTHAVDVNSKIEAEIVMQSGMATDSHFATHLLPPGCEHHKVIKGNPHTAKTLLFGQVHGVCDHADFQCMKALSKGKSKKTTTILFEPFASGQHTLCDDPLRTDNQPWREITDTCKGWNWPQVGKDGQSYPQEEGKLETLKEVVAGVHKNFIVNHVFGLPLEEQSSMAKEVIEAVKNHVRGLVEAEKQKHETIFKNYKKLHPKVKYENFTSASQKRIQRIEYSIKVLDNVATKIKLGTPAKKVSELLDKAIENHSNNMRKLSRATNFLNAGGLHDVQQQNKYLAKSVRDASQEYSRVLVQAGDAHVNPNPLLQNQLLRRIAPSDRAKIQEGMEICSQAVLDLYKELDQFADENPYAVLSCTLEPDWDSTDFLPRKSNR